MAEFYNVGVISTATSSCMGGKGEVEFGVGGILGGLNHGSGMGGHGGQGGVGEEGR